MTTQEVSEIFWRGELRTGVTAYGLWLPEAPASVAFPAELWPEGTEYETTRLRATEGPQWEVLVWDILIVAWPPESQWEQTLRGTLHSLRDEGAAMAWFGEEGAFSDPPELFSTPGQPGVYAALSDRLGFACTAQLDKPFALLDAKKLGILDEELKEMLAHQGEIVRMKQALSPEDWESVVRVGDLLATRGWRQTSLEKMMDRWARFASEVERGYRGSVDD
jgi:hypothetical protein